MSSVGTISLPIPTSSTANRPAQKAASTEEAAESTATKIKEALSGGDNETAAPKASAATSDIGQLLNIVA